ncbi:M48 family metallopeptidase [Pseudooceanicola sp.]|uniref:M48 family metallopeptidase n=1 Tax=Pseudooceanicola sp. TaxID=1914328 RepID=UPI00261953A6|nr:M48 family metallopeptidase [Pseudooceanicola sp.]MDF1855257.1 M48 family metallopeptidase [Pseudooceanicola sp.]
MIARLLVTLAAALALAGCASTGPGPAPASPRQVERAGMTEAEAETAARRFVSVVRTVEPVAERECRARAPGLNCDYLIVVDDRPDQPANAFQSRDSSGRPVIAFTLALIADIVNADELAFVMSHEAAHHIRNHLDRQRMNATAGAQLLGGLASIAGAGMAGVELAAQIGATVGARSYSKEFELEADALGARIAQAAGYDALRGALYFSRIADPGDQFLGTHPPNADRLDTVRRALEG